MANIARFFFSRGFRPAKPSLSILTSLTLSLPKYLVGAREAAEDRAFPQVCGGHILCKSAVDVNEIHFAAKENCSARLSSKRNTASTA